MGMMARAIGFLFGGGRNAIAETAEVFVENTENAAAREAFLRSAALEQFASEFAGPKRGGFDRFMDGINRIPRPLMAFGTIGLCVSAMVDPVWFGARMAGLTLVPEPLWWLLGAIVSFYFGARYQVQSQDFQKSMAQALASAPQVAASLQAYQGAKSERTSNAALKDWREVRRE